MKSAKLKALLETATTTGAIDIAPVPFNGSKKEAMRFGLDPMRKQLKVRKDKKKEKDKVIDPNSFSMVSEYDYSKTTQEATEIARKYKEDGLSIDSIIAKLAKVFDVSVIKQAIRGLK